MAMTTHTRFQGGKWHSSVDSTIMFRASKCESPRFRVSSNATVLATALLVTLSIAVSTSYLRLVQDSLKHKLSTETTSNIDVPTHVRGTSASLSQPPAAAAFPISCSWICYVENYEDLHHMIDSEELATNHWMNHGAIEGRDCACRQLPDDCNWKCYLDNYDDLKPTESTKQNAIHHYFKYGIAEDRDCTCPPNFRVKTANDTAAICVIASEEEMYVDEWLDFHLGLGFGHIYIYDNSDNFDLGNGWLDRRPRLTNKVTVQHFPGEGKQLSAYRHCLKNYVRPHGHGWVAFLDVDEFLILKKHANVVDFLLSYCKQGSVSLNWQLFGYDNQMTFSPQPVTRRFQGQVWVKENIHVKTISNVDAIRPGQPTNPHYARLVDGHHQLDTNGNIVSKMWNNEARPTDVALVYHYHTKSHKEYIAKRSRGRSDMSGGKLDYTVTRNLEAAKRGDYLLPTDHVDSSAWETLRLKNRYTIFDSLDIARQNLSSKQDSSSVFICALASSQESSYIDEWVDYHLALGVSRMYLFDSSKEFWMRQWAEERSNVEMTHVPGNSSDPEFTAKIYSKCLDTFMMPNERFVLMSINDFLMPLQSIGQNLRGGTGCAARKVNRVVFGNANQLIYDPLPVTKRFQFRVGKEIALPPVLLLTSPVPEKVILEYLTSEYWVTKYCEIESTKLTSYYYTRSVKECRLQASNNEICSLTGDVWDTSGWDKVQDLLPEYSGYNDFL
eukprot:scaffold120703_cov42-Cyclotella_meneghiniana.AAC.3